MSMKNAKAITENMIDSYAESYAQNKHKQAVANALSKNAINNISFVQNSLSKTHYNFSIDIPTMPVTNQKQSGRCWIFAGLNLLRESVGKKCNLESFELSQNYTAFWDKYEKINYFLESVLDLIDRPVDDRELLWVLSTGIQDGGQWDMFVSLVEKYGVVPKDAMDESYQSSHTPQMNALINRKLRQSAAKLQKMHQSGENIESLQKAKEAILNDMYAFLCMNFGRPPKKFDFEYVDKDKAYHVDRDLDAKSFYQKYVGINLQDYVSIINAPTKDKPFNNTYTVDYIGNVVDGNPILYLNLEMPTFIELVLKQLKDGEIVWFGSDVAHYREIESGIWNDKAFDFETAFDMDFELSKEDMMDYRHSAMNHAMVITGVNLTENGTPDKWKIENSWSDKNGDKGYYLMSDSWFEKFVYQAVVHKKYLSEEQKTSLNKEPKHLSPWDPMGTLAE